VSRFLLFYFIFYGGAHVYFYLKLWLTLPLSRRTRLGLIPPLTLLFIAPLLARVLDRNGYELSAEIASNAGYWWMGILFLFICPSLLIDLVNLVLLLLRKLLKNVRIVVIPARANLIVPAAYAAVVAAYGYHEARSIRTERVTLSSPKIPAEIGSIRIVQISDVHAGQIVREKRIKEILRVVRAASPDILISTGDLVDGHQRHIRGLEPLFRDVTPPLGKYAITGNHEYYIGLEKSITFTEDAGFTLLRDSSASIGNWLTISGLDDPSSAKLVQTRRKAERQLLDAAGSRQFILLLKHRPDILPESRGRFDLQLSGHVHKGQIFPFNILTWLAYPIKTGLTDLGNGSRIYVSRGTGVWGPPIRFLAPPEVTVIDLVAEKIPSR